METGRKKYGKTHTVSYIHIHTHTRCESQGRRGYISHPNMNESPLLPPRETGGEKVAVQREKSRFKLALYSFQQVILMLLLEEVPNKERAMRVKQAEGELRDRKWELYKERWSKTTLIVVQCKASSIAEREARENE